MLSIYLTTQQFTAGGRIQLFQCHLFASFDSSHFLHHFLQNQQIQTGRKANNLTNPIACIAPTGLPFVGFQLIGHVLQQTAQFDVVLLVDGATKVCQTLQPHRYRCAVMFETIFVRL